MKNLSDLEKWSGFISADTETKNKMIKVFNKKVQENKVIDFSSNLIYWKNEDFCKEMQFSTNDF